MDATIHGSCACGRVRLALMPPTVMFSHCHCRSCRGVHGTAFVS